MMKDPFTKNSLWDYWKKGDDQEVLTTKTYEEYKNELNNDPKEPWSENGVPYELTDHICEPFCFNTGKTKWPTCSSNEDGNGGELLGMVRVGYMTYFQDYEWYGRWKVKGRSFEAKIYLRRVMGRCNSKSNEFLLMAEKMLQKLPRA
ncbi:hypothetical protein Tco_0550286 [Tanacetum coccineum]